MSTPQARGVSAAPLGPSRSWQLRCPGLTRATSRHSRRSPAAPSLERLLESGPLCGAALLLALPLQTAPQTSAGSSQLGSRRAESTSSAQPTYTITPERRALLDTIRYAEGTWRGGSPEGYRVLYGGGLFASLKRHPDITVRRRYTSAAAGAYQFLPATWREASRKLGLEDFSPDNQDQAALYLVERRGALQAVDQSGLGSAVLARLSPEWASLPASHGGSHYGQPVKSRQDLISFYAIALERARQQLG